MSSSKDAPDHYLGHSIEPFDVIDSWGLDYYLGSAVKYLCRAGKKPGESVSDDLKKALVFINHRLSLEEKQ